MLDFYRKHPVAHTTKAHRCRHCGETIAPGSSALSFAQRYEGEFDSGYLHQDCAALWQAAFARWGDESLPWSISEVVADFSDSCADARSFLNGQRHELPEAVARVEAQLAHWLSAHGKGEDE